MELQQLRYVVAVAETRNFTRAAERSHVVQSALSQQIGRLERELGVRLFARTSRRVALTPEGEAFVVRARETLASAERAVAEASAASGTIRGTVGIGAIPTVAAVDLPGVLAAFRQAHPQVRMMLRSGGSHELVAGVLAGDLDVAFLGLPDGDDPVVPGHRLLVRDRHVVVVPTSHRLAGRARVRLADIVEETFVDFPADSPGRQQSDRAFLAAGLTRSVHLETYDLRLMLGLVRAGVGTALLPSRVVADVPDLALVPVTRGPRRAEYLVWNDFNPTPAGRALLGTIEQIVGTRREGDRG